MPRPPETSRNHVRQIAAALDKDVVRAKFLQKRPVVLEAGRRDHLRAEMASDLQRRRAGGGGSRGSQNGLPRSSTRQFDDREVGCHVLHPDRGAFHRAQTLWRRRHVAMVDDHGFSAGPALVVEIRQRAHAHARLDVGDIRPYRIDDPCRSMPIFAGRDEN